MKFKYLDVVKIRAPLEHICVILETNETETKVVFTNNALRGQIKIYPTAFVDQYFDLDLETTFKGDINRLLNDGT